jgi:predicted DsbA family dithiol-disulfide isomerase
MPGMRIDIVSDMICPWCYLGKRRLEAALAGRPDLAAEIHWLPFELNPAMPEGGLPRDEYLAAKLGGLDALREAQSRLTELGAREGIVYRFDRIALSPNTRRAHALARIAAEAGREDAVIDALFRAYFEDGDDIGDIGTLVRIAAGAGLGGPAVETRLRSGVDGPAIESLEREIRAAGISGVPLFILDRRLALSGAQEPQAFERAFRQLDSGAGE